MTMLSAQFAAPARQTRSAGSKKMASLSARVPLWPLKAKHLKELIMLRQTLLGLAASAALLGAPSAHAGDVWWSVSVGLPAVAFNVPPPIAYPAPPPVVYAPPPPAYSAPPPPVRYWAQPRSPVVYNAVPYGYVQAANPGWGPRPYGHDDRRDWRHDRRHRHHHDND